MCLFWCCHLCLILEEVGLEAETEREVWLVCVERDRKRGRDRESWEGCYRFFSSSISYRQFQFPNRFRGINWNFFLFLNVFFIFLLLMWLLCCLFLAAWWWVEFSGERSASTVRSSWGNLIFFPFFCNVFLFSVMV